MAKQTVRDFDEGDMPATPAQILASHKPAGIATQVKGYGKNVGRTQGISTKGLGDLDQMTPSADMVAG